MTQQERDMIAEMQAAGLAMATELEDYVGACGNSPPECPGCPSCRPAREAIWRWARANWRWHRALEGAGDDQP